jgi:hypothetical protein
LITTSHSDVNKGFTLEGNAQSKASSAFPDHLHPLLDHLHPLLRRIGEEAEQNRSFSVSL